MSTLPQRDATVLLRDQDEWTTWINQIQARAAVYNIWNNLNPDHPVPFLVEPTLPEPPELSGYHPATGIQEASRPSELSAQGQKAFKEDMEHYKTLTERYKLNYRKYEMEQKSIQHLTALIQSTVAPHLQRTCCLPNQPLQKWLSNLKLTVGVDDRIEQERARERYHAALKPMRNTNNWDTWLAEYDQASSDAAAYSVPEVTQINGVTKDFLSAVAKIAPIWATTFQDTGRFEPLMSRREMMKRFREHMSVHHPLRSGKHRAGAFATADDASFLAEGGATTQGSKRDASTAAESAPSTNRIRGRPRYQRQGNQALGHQASSNKRPSDYEPANAGSKCPACGQRHGVKDCYYIYEDQAPEWWHPNETIKSLIEYKRKNDTAFQGLLRGQSKLRSQSRSHTPIIKKSQTPTPTIQELEDDL
jgi:hypothetical protein